MATRPADAPAADTPVADPTPQHGADFDNAFAAAAAEFSGEEPPAPVEEPAAPPPAAEEPAAAPSAEEPAAPPAETPPPEEAPAAAPSAEDIVKGLADLLKQPAAPAETPAAPAAEAPANEEPLYQPTELEVMEEYQKNWPDVFKAEQLVRRAEYHDLMKFVFGQVASYVAPLFDQVRTIGNNLHISEVKGLVPGYNEDLERDVAAWVETQPSYLQAGMKQVMQSGTSDDIADLIGRYQEATGKAPAPTAPAATPPATPPAPAQTELSKAAKQAVASLAPVSSERSQVPAGEDPGDYDSAFARYAAEAMKPK